jgi:hypothetical protein
MRNEYLKEQLAKHGIKTIVPAREEDLKQIFQHIMEELGFNIFNDSTRKFFAAQVRELVGRGAQGVILGCTEIELLIQQEHTPEVPLFLSAELHIKAVAEIQAGVKHLSHFIPEVDAQFLKNASKKDKDKDKDKEARDRDGQFTAAVFALVSVALISKRLF